MRLAAPCLLLTLALATPVRAEEPLAVLATTGMIGDIAARIGGDCARVETLIGPGADPHLFTPAPSDLQALQGAELILYSGLNLEGQLGQVLDRLSASRPVAAVAEAVPQEMRLTEGDQPDPHVWMDPGLWSLAANRVAQELTALRPGCAAPMAEALAALAADLAALDAWSQASLDTIPGPQRHLITAHDAFAYFGAAYSVPVTAIQGISTAAEAAIADIDAVAEVVVTKGVPAVFVESTINPRTIEALREAVAARGGAVTTGGELFADAMGAPGTPEGTYLGMIRHNIETITTALGGQPAPWPLAAP